MTDFTNNFELNKAHRDSFFKSPENDIEKASKGEGSKGGMIIGHTKSGKPIYGEKHASFYEDFDTEDHLDAEKAHKAKVREHQSTMSRDQSLYTQKKISSVIDLHQARSKSHGAIADKRITEEENKVKKSESDDIIKGGEGSRGGKVIGHTKTGKPIYDRNKATSESNPSHYPNGDKYEHDSKAGFDDHSRVAFKFKQKESQPTYKHISDMSKDEMHTQAEKMSIKGHKDMSEKELQKKLVEANVDKELEKMKSKHSLNQKLNSYLDKYPDNATSWSQADDGVRDMARAARNHYNEHELDVLEDDPKAIKPLDFQSFKTPSEWNTKGKKYIQEVVSKMSDKTKSAFERQIAHQLGDKVEKSIDTDSLQKAYDVLGLK